MLTPRQRVLLETDTTRQRAEQLLKALLAAQDECERVTSMTMRSDPIKSVTGSSAIETAIASTRRMIETLDRATNDARRSLEEPDQAFMDTPPAPPVRANGNGAKPHAPEVTIKGWPRDGVANWV